jgi:hypothetical protein
MPIMKISNGDQAGIKNLLKELFEKNCNDLAC